MITSGSGIKLRRVVIIDGYVDEPTCLGVPPYISPYPRYIAGAIWSQSPSTDVLYQTIDTVRRTTEPQNSWTKSDLIILIAGMIVPGKYVGGTPISVKEAKNIFSDSRIENIPKILAGPWGKFGCGLEGGRLALSSDQLSPPFDLIITGDPEVVISDIIKNSRDISSIDPTITRENSQVIDPFVVKGSRIVTQHPGFTRGYMICEIETYRGCPRFLSGGCSFCTEPLQGEPLQRKINAIVKEIEALYTQGVRAFRIGNQADLFTYGSSEIGEEEFPKPSPTRLDELFSKIRQVAPELEVLHIDNVNPGTVARHPEESKEVAKVIMKYHTSGDVAAFGVESVDPEVIKRNNLKATEEEIISAVRLLNKVGGKRSPWGLPHLLPGINLLYGLIGESKRTLEYNKAFLQGMLDEGLIVRRINIRQVIGFPDTRMSGRTKSKIRRNEFFSHKEWVRKNIDREMISRVAPPGTIIESAFIDRVDGNHYLMRPLGTYPPLCYMPKGQSITNKSDVFVVDHGPRSLTVLPYPLHPNTVSLSQWKAIPRFGKKRAARIKSAPVTDLEDFESRLDESIPQWLKEKLRF